MNFPRMRATLRLHAPALPVNGGAFGVEGLAA
jgi:hypothetical protein